MNAMKAALFVFIVAPFYCENEMNQALQDQPIKVVIHFIIETWI